MLSWRHIQRTNTKLEHENLLILKKWVISLKQAQNTGSETQDQDTEKYLIWLIAIICKLAICI